MVSSVRCSIVALFLMVWGIGAPSILAQEAREAGFTQVTRPVAELRDPQQIEDLLGRLLITPEIPQDSISRIEVIDITENGYGPDDVLVVYPSGGTYMIRPNMVTGRVQDIMSEWQLESEFQYDGRPNIALETLRPDPAQAGTTEADTAGTDTTQTPGFPPQEEWPQYGIMADVLETVNRNYGGNQISLLLERDATGFTMQMWDYNPQAMAYRAPPAGPPDTVQTRDLVYVVRSDSVIYDVVYINKTVEETKYVPRGPTSAVPSNESRGSPRGEAESSKATDPERRRR